MKCKLKQRVKKLEKILKMYNNLLYEIIEHIELETRAYCSEEPHNNSEGKYHKELRESLKILEDLQFEDWEEESWKTHG